MNKFLLAVVERQWIAALFVKGGKLTTCLRLRWKSKEAASNKAVAREWIEENDENEKKNETRGGGDVVSREKHRDTETTSAVGHRSGKKDADKATYQ